MDLDRAMLAYRNAAASTVVGVHNDDPDAILTVARDSGLSAYDAHYVCMAQSLGVFLVTEDKQILRAYPDIARSMRQFLSPPESPMVVREKAATYKTRRAGKRGRS
jgi:hypothetical protein